MLALWKPWGHVSQWHAKGEHPGLGELLSRPAGAPSGSRSDASDGPGAGRPGASRGAPRPSGGGAGVGPDVRCVGRLDHDSEGLLLLTDDGGLSHRLTEPAFGHPRTYWAQVERLPGADALARLAAGPPLNDGPTRPCEVRLLDAEPALPPRPVPIRVRMNIPTAWLELTLIEGRNRQVRRMTAAVGHPTLRLVRVAVGPLRLLELGLEPGRWRPLTADEERALRASAGVGSAGGRTGGARRRRG